MASPFELHREVKRGDTLARMLHYVNIEETPQAASATQAPKAD
jgi:hypothetical protein